MLLVLGVACGAPTPAESPALEPDVAPPASGEPMPGGGGVPAVPAEPTTGGVPAAGEARFGRVDRYSPALDAIVPSDWNIEKLASGFAWAEGPAWIASGGYLLFTDVPGNTLHKWSEQGGLETFLKPSGLAEPDPKLIREAGLNGLHAEGERSVLAGDSGNRAVVRLELATKKKTVLASHYQNKRFNSPNDVTVHRASGAIFFTDPPYGLEGLDRSKLKELAFNGVYRLSPDGAVELVDDRLPFPNGIALSPDERTLYVANSDRARPIWIAYALDAAGKVTARRQLADASDLVKDDAPGGPDGLTVAADGTVFATGPGGVIVMTASGERLGRIATGKPIANCEFGDDGRSLYLTSHDTLARIRLNARGQGFTAN